MAVRRMYHVVVLLGIVQVGCQSERKAKLELSELMLGPSDMGPLYSQVRCPGGERCLIGAIVGDNTQEATLIVKGFTGSCDVLSEKKYPFPAMATSAFDFPATGGFVCAGAVPNKERGYDIHVYRFDESGQKTWVDSSPGKGWLMHYDVISLLDGGFVVAGPTPALSKEQPRNYYDTLAWKLDEGGKTRWQYQWGGPEQERVLDALEYQGGLALIGTLAKPGDTDTYVALLDSEGALIQETSHGSKANPERGIQAVALSSGDLAILIEADVEPTAEVPYPNQVGVLRMNSRGQEVWTKLLSRPGGYEGRGIARNSRDELFLTGCVSNRAFVAKLTRDGELEWERRIGDTGVNGSVSIAVMSTGNVIFTANMDQGPRVFTVKERPPASP